MVGDAEIGIELSHLIRREGKSNGARHLLVSLIAGGIFVFVVFVVGPILSWLDWERQTATTWETNDEL